MAAIAEALTAEDRHDEATDVAQMGLKAIVDFAKTQPQSMGDLLRSLGRSYVSSCQQAGRQPDRELLRHAATVLHASFEARFKGVLAAVATTDSLDEELAALETEMAELRQWAGTEDQIDVARSPAVPQSRVRLSAFVSRVSVCVSRLMRWLFGFAER
jgi:hypothetical protein